MVRQHILDSVLDHELPRVSPQDSEILFELKYVPKYGRPVRIEICKVSCVCYIHLHFICVAFLILVRAVKDTSKLTLKVCFLAQTFPKSRCLLNFV